MTDPSRQHPGAAAAHPFLQRYIQPAKQVVRWRLMDRLSEQSDAHHLLINAQAGQGKSTFAAQLLHRTGCPFVWHQGRPEDQDPMLLFTSLYQGAQRQLPGFASPLIDRIIEQGGLQSGREDELARHLTQGLAEWSSGQVYLVADDVHLVEESPASLRLLAGLIQHSPPEVRCILAGRHRIVDRLLPCMDRPVLTMVEVDNDMLALTKNETAELFSTKLSIAVNSATVARLHATTEGWVMGLRLLAHAMATQHGLVVEKFPATPLSALSWQDMTGYFDQALFSGLSPGLKRTLARLSLLDTIPTELAMELAEVKDITAALLELTKNNLFMRGLGSAHGWFEFHHLFRDFLRERAVELLSPDEIRTTHLAAGAFFTGADNQLEALNHFLKAPDFARAASILAREGTRMLALNQIILLKNQLERLPREIIRAQPWLAYFYAVIQFDMDPPEAFDLLEQARAAFVRTQDPVGELTATSYFLHFNIVVDGRFDRAMAHIDRAETLLEQVGDTLPPLLTIQVCNVLVLARTYVRFDYDKALAYARRLQSIADLRRYSTFQAAASISMQLLYAIKGEWSEFRREIERSQPLLSDPALNLMFQGYLRNIQLNLLILEGDFFNYTHVKQAMADRLTEAFLSRSMHLAYTLLWDGTMFLAQGRLRQALAAFTRGGDLKDAAGNMHMRGQFLHWQALCLALNGQSAAADRAARETLRLRKIVGGTLYAHYCWFLVGACRAVQGRPDEAQRYFAMALEDDEYASRPDFRAAVLAHRSRLRLEQGQRRQALDDLQKCLGLMRAHDFRHFLSWTPALMETLLVEAVRENIEPELARELAADRLDKALLNDGSVHPLLMVRTLGSLEMTLDGRTVVRVHDLSPIQRLFLAQILAAPGLTVSRRDITDALWPDSPPDKAKAAFDTTLSRLRKALDSAFQGRSSKIYLTVDQGMVCLVNTRVDARQFRLDAKRGLDHLAREEFWQAGNALRRAFALWQGEFLPGVGGEGSHGPLREQLASLLCEAAQSWAPVLAGQDQKPQALSILELACSVEPIHHGVNEMLFAIHMAAGQNAQAERVLRRYRSALHLDGFSTVEIKEACREIRRFSLTL